MAFQFPPSPTAGQTFTPVAGVTYRWSGTAWHLIAGPGSFITTTEADVRYVNIDEAQNTTNRIINGKMAIDQRNAGAAVNPGNGVLVYGADRWFGVWGGGAGRFTFQRTPGNYLAINVTTSEATQPAQAYYIFGQMIEGINVADFNFGTANAQPFTFAFEIASSIAGTFPVTFRKSDGTRSYVAPVTIQTGGFRTVSITVPGDTAVGTWESGAGGSLRVSLALATGSDHVGPANTWASSAHISVAGCTNFMTTLGTVWQIANVRLYKGSVDFGPDRRLYAEELALCQRYYWKTYPIDVVPGTVTAAGKRALMPVSGTGFSGVVSVPFPVRMRATPTLTLYSPTTGATGVWEAANPANAPVAGSDVNDSNTLIYNTATTGASQTVSGHIVASAEL